MKILGAIILLAALVACSPTNRPTPTVVPPTSTATTTPLPYEACGWAWAQQSLPEISASLREALAADGLRFDAEKTYAYAFGENCLGPDGQIDHFAAMETDFVITTSPGASADPAVLGDYAGAVLRLILAEFPPLSVVPGPQPGYAEFVFVDGSGESHHRVSLADGKLALETGVTGEALFRTLFP